MKMIIEDMQSHYIGRKIRVNVALPEGYDPRANYPILYMHDGQSVFDLLHYPKYDWHINTIFDQLHLQWIIVAIDSPNDRIQRINLYYPWEFQGLENFLPGKRIEKNTTCGGHAGRYVEFFIRELIPKIENLYPSGEVRAMAGASLGAVISLYIANQHPIFDYLGIFSPAIWFDKDRFLNYCQQADYTKAHMYISIGTHETSDDTIPSFPQIYTSQAQELAAILETKTPSFVFRIEENGMHDGPSWHRSMRNFVQTYLSHAHLREQ